jgi:hypothetical protein
MKLTVHIGSAKTGSTSVQAFLQTNQKLLGKKGVYMPKSFRFRNHTAAALACLPFERTRQLGRNFKLKTEAEFGTFQRDIVAGFNHELNALNDNAHVVITSEHLQSRLTKTHHVEAFRSLFASRFDTVEIVVYLRPQVEMLASLYSTLLKTGGKDTLDETLTRLTRGQYSAYYDFQALIKRWASVFGEEAMNVRAYAALDMANGGAVSDFCEVLGLPGNDPAYVAPEKTNTSISETAQAVLLRLNRTKRLKPKKRRRVVLWMEENAPGKAARLDTQSAALFHKKFKEGNQWVTETYFPGHPEYLTPRIFKTSD